MALAVSALVPGLAAALIDVPFLCHVRRAIEIVDTLPYDELTRYLSIHRAEVDAALATVEHADGLHFAARGKTPSLWSVGLRDEITPPSTVFAAYNHYAGPKEIRVLPYSGHDAGALQHVNEQLAFLAGSACPTHRPPTADPQAGPCEGSRASAVRRAAAPTCSWPVTASRKSGRAIASSTAGSTPVTVAVRGTSRSRAISPTP